MTQLYAAIAALGVVTALRTRISWNRSKTDRRSMVSPPASGVLAWRSASAVVHDGLWTLLAVWVFQIVNHDEALPWWLIVGIAGAWIAQLFGIALNLGFRDSATMLVSWPVRLLQHPITFSLIWLFGFASGIAIPLFWAILFVRLVGG